MYEIQRRTSRTVMRGSDLMHVAARFIPSPLWLVHGRIKLRKPFVTSILEIGHASWNVCVYVSPTGWFFQIIKFFNQPILIIDHI